MHACLMSETFTEHIDLTMPPAQKQRLQTFADEQNWHLTAAIRYFVLDGLDGADRRAELAKEAADCWPPR
jgi:hypothetical protein